MCIYTYICVYIHTPLTRTSLFQTVLIGRSTTAAAYENMLGRDSQGRALQLASSGSRDLPLMKYSFYHPEGEVDSRGAVAEYPALVSRLDKI